MCKLVRKRGSGVHADLQTDRARSEILQTASTQSSKSRRHRTWGLDIAIMEVASEHRSFHAPHGVV